MKELCYKANIRREDVEACCPKREKHYYVIVVKFEPSNQIVGLDQ